MKSVMNLPVGKIIEQGLELNGLAVKELLESFMERGFSGYIVSTVWGFSGIEEGLFLFRSGVFVGAFFEYFSLGKTFLGDYSLSHVFNSFAAEKGVVDIVGLSVPQVDLITAFNSDLKVTAVIDKKSLSRYFVKKYSPDLAMQVVSEEQEVPSENKSVFKKLGLTGLGE